ncbi:hypothetical protein ACOSQ2_013598 [Xanthoceras sorbifolium]
MDLCLTARWSSGDPSYQTSKTSHSHTYNIFVSIFFCFGVFCRRLLAMAESSKKTRGKQKISIKRIENEEDKMITFSKRRSGIYKKASELVTLTGAEVGVMMFSPSGKLYSFGHPSIEVVSNRCMGLSQLTNDNTDILIEAHRQVRIAQLNQYHNGLLRQLDTEKERGKILKEIAKGKKTQGWREASIDELNVEELHQMDAAFRELSKKFHNKLNEKSLGGGGI